MTLSVSQLKTPPTRDEIAQWMIDRAQELGFQVTGWQPGGAAHTLINILAAGVSFMAPLSADTVKNIYNSTSSGAGLTARALNSFNNIRVGAEKAKGIFTFTNSGTAPTPTFAPGAVIVEDETGTQFTNTVSFSVGIGGSSVVIVDMEALLAGSAGNIANNSTLILVDPIAGVTVTNPGPGSGAAWYTYRTGTDPETDLTLRERNATKWGLLSIEKTATGVKNLALAQEGVSKTRVIHDNPRGAGTVDVYVASGSDLVSTGDKTTAQANFATYFMGTTATYPPETDSRYHILDPSTLELLVEGAVYYDPQYTEAEVQANLSQSLGDFVDLLPIGGIEYVTNDGKVTLGDILEVMEGTRGVRSVTLTNPSGNIDVGNTTLVTAPADWITGRLTFSAVTS